MKIRTFRQGADCNIQPHFSQKKEHEYYIPTAEIKEITGGHFLPEPRKDAAALYLDDDFEKDLEVDDISSMFHYSLKSYRGGLDSNSGPVEVKHELKCGVFDGMLHDDGVPNIQPHIDIRNACEDYFLDFDLTKKVPELDYRFCEESGTDDSSNTYSPGATNEASQQAESQNPEPDCHPNQFEIITPFHGPSGTPCTFPVDDESHLQCATCLRDGGEKRPDAKGTSFESDHWHGKNIIRFRNPGRILFVPRNGDYDDITSPQCEEEDMQDAFIGSNDELRNAAPPLEQKRLRKPPQRYIDEWSHTRSHNRRVSKKRSASSNQEKHFGVRSQNNHWHGESETTLLVSRVSSPGRSPRPVPFLEHQDFLKRSLPEKKYQGKYEDFSTCFSVKNLLKNPTTEPILNYRSTVYFDSDDEYDPAYSNSKKRILGRASDRRKRNTPWSLPEVVKLVDGISRFGVGKWTAIKKIYFSSSSCRTSLDIRDKWRNLVRASCVRRRDGSEGEPQRSSTSQPLPKALLQRISELASVYPYPRQGSKLSRTSKRDFFLPCPE